jgi:predicted deacylase
VNYGRGKNMMENVSVSIGDITVAPGERVIVDLPVADLYTHTQLTMPVHIVNGRSPGPTLFITAAVHGDELNGVEIIRRVLKTLSVKRLKGCVLAAPIVNVFGFINRSRYLPDRRDLNRSFPGREQGSIAARLAFLVANEIVANADFGLDLHTGAIDRANLPQIRANLDDPEVLKLAEAFGTPVILDSELRDGSLRQYANEKGVPMLVYEAGEALRFDELSIRAGVRGVSRVMRVLGMLPSRAKPQTPIPSVRTNATTWVRAPVSGIVSAKCRLGERVKAGEILGSVSDPFSEVSMNVVAPKSGVVIGRSTSPLSHEGDALFHLARFEDNQEAKATVDEFQEVHSVQTTWG